MTAQMTSHAFYRWLMVLWSFGLALSFYGLRIGHPKSGFLLALSVVLLVVTARDLRALR